MSDQETLLPVYHKDANDHSHLLRDSRCCSMQISFFKFAWITIGFSLFSFLFCVYWSISFNFEEANATHCSVENYLPSISAATGHFYPQIYVWKTTILIQMIPRVRVSSMYFSYYQTVIHHTYSKLYNFLWGLSIWELSSLLGLSLVTSTANYTFHAFCFVCFLFASISHMILSCYLLKFKRMIPPDNVESRTLKLKTVCCLFNIFCFLMAGYFFRRHNTYCEPGVYSIFALFEYGVVISNMFFHLLAAWDFYDKTLTMSLSGAGFKIDYRPRFKSVTHHVREK